MTKKTIYILLFVVLGVIVSGLLHAGVEIAFMKLLIRDFDKYGLSWYTWQIVHAIGSITILSLGIFVGYKQGRYWWDVVYVNGKFRK